MWKKLFGPQSPSEYEARVVKALEAGDPRRALELSAEALARFPTVIEARLLHSKVLALSGQIEAAVQTMDASVDRYPTSSWMQKGHVLTRAGDLPRAIECYGRAAGADPEYADAWLAWGTALADNGQHELALSKYDQAASLDPKESIVPLNRGNSLSSLHRLDEALESYEKAQSLGSEAALGCIRSTLLELGRVAEANSLPGALSDGRGEARERRRELASGALVARYFVGSHTNPELLDAVVEKMLEGVAALEHVPPGLPGKTIQYGWPLLLVRHQGPLLVLCEPDWQVETATNDNYVEHVSFSAMQLVQALVLQNLTGAEPRDCSCRQTIFIERGALDASRCTMSRREATSELDSGWMIRHTTDPELRGAPIPMTLLVSAAPYLLRVVNLPIGWSAYFVDGQVERVLDSEGKERLPRS